MLLLSLLMLLTISLFLYFTKLPLYLLYTVIPAVAALLCGITVSDTINSLLQGALIQLPSALLLLTSTAFFSLLSETGMFSDMALRMLPEKNLSPKRLLYSTFVAGLVISLCGLPSVTYLVTITAFRPYYEELGMDKLYLGLTAALAMSVGLAWPWSSKTVILAGIAHTDSGILFWNAIPLQVIAAALSLLCLRRIGCKIHAGRCIVTEKTSFTASSVSLYCLLAIAVGALIFMNGHAPYILFGECAVIAVVLYKKHAEYKKCFARATQRSIVFAANIAAIGAFIGLIENTGILSALISAISGFMPAGIASLMPVLFSALSPVLLLILPFQSMYALLPILTASARINGISPVGAVLPFVLLFPSACLPSVPSTYIIDQVLQQKRGTHFRFTWTQLSVIHIIVAVLSVLI